ncbi:EAL domain-containing protein [Aquitalea aquatilis]|uniref:EAL domain-containing protein n=1 Tax=Aquitalea aquatilis TaxID=1537400 RepID=UPI0010BD9DD9|nr:EAL domain-containing protein [Aquitalea aquatilis]
MIRVGVRWVLLAIVLPALAGLIASVISLYSAEREQFNTQAMQVAHLLSDEVDAEVLGAQRALLGFVATNQNLIATDWLLLRKRSQQFLEATDYGDSMELFDRSGQELMNTRITLGDHLPRSSNLPTIERVFKTGRPQISDLFLRVGSHNPRLIIVVPIIVDGKIAYCMGLSVRAERFSRFTQSQSLPSGWVAAIYDQVGHFVARTDEADKYVGKMVPPTLQYTLGLATEGLTSTSYQEGLIILGAFKRSTRSGLSVATGEPSVIFVMSLVKKLTLPISLVLVIIFLSIILIQRFSGQIKRSLNALSNAVDSTIAGKDHDMVQLLAPSEFMKVADQLNAMLVIKKEAATTLHEVQRLAGIGLWEWDLEKDIHIWSEEVYRIYGRDMSLPPAAYPAVLFYYAERSMSQLLVAITHCLETGKEFILDVEVIRTDGSHRWVTMAGNARCDATGRVVRLQGLIQDITQRKESEQVLERLNRSLLLVCECNGVLVHASVESELLYAICELIVRVGNYAMAWVGTAIDDNFQFIQPIAQAGDTEDYLTAVRLSQGMKSYGSGPASKAISSQETQVVQNIKADPSVFPWRDIATDHGYQSCMALPLIANGQTLAVLVIYATEVNAFLPDEIDLLKQLANDLAFGMYALRTELARQKAVTEHQASEQRYRTVLDHAADAVMIADVTGKLVYANVQAVNMLGYDADHLLELCVANVSVDNGARWSSVTQALTQKDFVRIETEVLRKDGTTVPVDVNAVQLPDGFYYGAFRDITEQKKIEAELSHLATHDKLTGLANRQLLNDRIGQAIAHAHRTGSLAATLLLDLDRFKTINDGLTHETGDSLLREIAIILSALVREGDTVARLGGDEFMVILLDLNSRDDVARLADKLLTAIRQPMKIMGYNMVVTGSLGIALYPEDGETARELIKNADVAMYRAKELGGNCFQYYAPHMNTRMLECLELEAELHQAIERKEFELFYQPQLDIPTRQIIGAEALIRWRHPIRGMVPPGAFIPLVEEAGLIIPIGDWVFESACMQLKKWAEMGRSDLVLSVNLSVRQLQQEGLAERLEQLIRIYNVNPNLLNLEVTESALMISPECATSILIALKKLGVKLSLDDFGTGYSSLNYLKRFPIDTLKIDQSFVRGISADHDDETIVRSVINLGHDLGMSVLAEGVETVLQLEFLSHLNCNEMQGYLFSPPVPIDKFNEILLNSPTV